MKTRIIIVLSWVALIFGFLYLPLLWKKASPRTINILSWTEVIDIKKVVEFEKKTGIKVNIGFYESNDELFVKLKVTKGAGYDLIVPSDYLVELFIKENLLQKIDKSKLNFWTRLNPHLLSYSYDPKNEYSIPYLWSIYGFGIDKNHPAFKNGGEFLAKVGYASLFDPTKIPATFVMIEDPREVILMAAYYHYGSLDYLTPEKIKSLKPLLIQQKKQVMSYTDVGAPYLLTSKQCPFAFAASPYILRLVPHYPAIDFVIPIRGTFAVIDNMVIPRLSTNQDLVYEFINFMYQQETLDYHVKKTFFFAPTTDVSFDHLPIVSRRRMQALMTREPFLLFKNVIPEKLVNKLWLAVKAA